jgi:hypothetical protein
MQLRLEREYVDAITFKRMRKVTFSYDIEEVTTTYASGNIKDWKELQVESFKRQLEIMFPTI